MNDFESWFTRAQMIMEQLEGVDLWLHEARFLELYQDGYTPRQAVEGFIDGYL